MRLFKQMGCALLLLLMTTGCPSPDSYTVRIINRASDVVITKIYMEDTSGPSIDTVDYVSTDIESGKSGRVLIPNADVVDFGPDSVLVIGRDGADEISAIIYANYKPGGSVTIRVIRQGGVVKFEKV